MLFEGLQWSMKEAIAQIEVQAVSAIEQIIDEAADRRWPVDAKTVEDAMNLIKQLQDSGTDISEDVLNTTLDDLEEIHTLVDGSPKRGVDHMAVQGLVEELTKECFESGIDV